MFIMFLTGFIITKLRTNIEFCKNFLYNNSENAEKKEAKLQGRYVWCLKIS